jgi:hypothetical protein
MQALALGWSVIGWLAAMALAVRRYAPAINVINQVHVPVSNQGCAPCFVNRPAPHLSCGPSAPDDATRRWPQGTDR